MAGCGNSLRQAASGGVKIFVLFCDSLVVIFSLVSPNDPCLVIELDMALRSVKPCQISNVGDEINVLDTLLVLC